MFTTEMKLKLHTSSFYIKLFSSPDILSSRTTWLFPASSGNGAGSPSLVIIQIAMVSEDYF